MAGFGASGSGGQGFAIRLEADGDSKIGNSSGDLHQMTGTLDVLGNSNFDGAAVFNESSADKDFRVESNNNANMFFVDGGANRIGVGTNSPQTLLDCTDPLFGTGADADAILRLRSKRDVGIKLIADAANTAGESDNPFIDFYQDAQNDTSGRSNRLASIGMEGNPETTFTGSLGNSTFISTFCPNAQSSSVRPFQIATDSSANGFRNRITIEGSKGHIGINQNTATAMLSVNGGISSSHGATLGNLILSEGGTGLTLSGTLSSSGGATLLGDLIVDDVKVSGSITVAGTAITSTPAELNLLDASVTSEPSDGVWAVVERVAKITVDSNDYARSAGPVSLGVTIPDNAILTKYVFDCTQTFAAGDDGSEAMAVVDLGLYNASGKVFDFASQANIERTGATSAPYVAAVSEVSPLAAASTKLTEALTAKIHVFDDGSGMLNSLDAGALDIYVYYIIGA